MLYFYFRIPFRYSLGENPVWALKYFRKVNCSGKPRRSAISLIGRSCWMSRCLAWLMVKMWIHCLGVWPEY